MTCMLVDCILMMSLSSYNVKISFPGLLFTPSNTVLYRMVDVEEPLLSEFKPDEETFRDVINFFYNNQILFESLTLSFLMFKFMRPTLMVGEVAFLRT